MKKLTLVAVVLCVVCFSAKVWAEGMSRVRLCVHGSQEISERIDIREHFVPSMNLVEGFDPFIFLGVGIRPIEGLDIEPIIGWHFVGNEPIIGVLLSFQRSRIWLFVDLEINIPSWFSSWFVMVDFKILEWLFAGIEGEGWGLLIDNSSWSNGGGFNLIFRLERIELDLALHARVQEGELILPDFLVRVQIFF